MATVPGQAASTGALGDTARRAIISIALALAAFFFVSRYGGPITLGDFLMIVAGVALGTTILLSLLRDPRQFGRALWERTVFTFWVPLACALIVAVFCLRIGFILFKISLKLILAGVAAVAYVLFPIDLVPDFLLGLGQIDDILIVISLAVWAMGAAVSESLRTSIRVARPSTPFP